MDDAVREQVLSSDQRKDERLPATPLSVIQQWFAPWLVGAALCLAFLLGLWMASRAADAATTILGFALAGLALVALVPTIFVETAEGLAVLVTLLGGLAVGGLILAARSPSPSLESTGYALFFIALGLIFWNMKHHFDRRDGVR